MNGIVVILMIYLMPFSNIVKVMDSQIADVLSVIVIGSEGNYNFKVKIHSPDKGCDQYADWWEVIDIQGKLLFRRILQHSHVNEQPFERSGGPIRISSNREIYIRAHINNTGYGGSVFGGSVGRGLESMELKPGFATGLEKTTPLPDDCAF